MVYPWLLNRANPLMSGISSLYYGAKRYHNARPTAENKPKKMEIKKALVTVYRYTLHKAQ